ncbi:NAD/NADP octopine/nopaline dehydrogenase family protein [Paenochrobactrum pullorum]|uniref:NAD/NADP octopine/nopaline dehydrogenase family protein n=1 Tax=Paenochrobactrum pullorum TaxID=1324351 RepID=UPI0035BBC109
MKVAILGAGGVALATVALLHQSGHQPLIWSPSGINTASITAIEVKASGLISGCFTAAVAHSVEEALEYAKIVIVALPANAHKYVFDEIAPHISDEHTLIISAQLSLGALYLSSKFVEHKVKPTTIAFATTVVMGRREGAFDVTIGGVRNLLEMAVLPEENTECALSLCQNLFGDRFRLADNLIAIALSNLNPPIHMASALCNFTRIEKAEYWANYDAITPSVARLIEALDQERLAVARAYAVHVRTAEEHYQLSFGFDKGMSIAEMAAVVHKQRNGPPGPTCVSTRFVTEDIPFGILQVIALAELKAVDVPLHKAGVAMFSALYGRDFTTENSLLAPALNFFRNEVC